MSEYIETLATEFRRHADPVIAAGQKAYMRNQFDYFGIKAPQRRMIQKPFLVKAYLPNKEELPDIIEALWSKTERDFHQFGMDLYFKYIKQLEKSDLPLLEYMVVHHSWWDTVDFIAYKLMGAYFKRFPEDRDKSIERWLSSDNMWLHRCCLLFQLKYKTELDEVFLSMVIHRLLGSKEFFINKAIGWVLREYSRTHPDWVVDFVENTELANLSRREALRLI